MGLRRQAAHFAMQAELEERQYGGRKISIISDGGGGEGVPLWPHPAPPERISLQVDQSRVEVLQSV